MLKGDHVGLRAIERADLPTLLEYRNRPHFRRFFREYRELSAEHQGLWFDKLVMSDPGTRMFAIEEIKTGRLLGACGLCYIDFINRSADFSIYIGADDLYIDEVFAPDAARVMIRYGFEELNLHRLWTCTACGPRSTTSTNPRRPFSRSWASTSTAGTGRPTGPKENGSTACSSAYSPPEQPLGQVEIVDGVDVDRLVAVQRIAEEAGRAVGLQGGDRKQ
jgi:RimJ/RimL family protein N-acetyltransferase